MTQMGLASIAKSSTRHLSYLETGRALPSREMVMRLAEELEIPLRERNALLLSAGFAPAFHESSLSELASAHRAIEQILEAHKPYPAFAVDRRWNIVLSNRAIPKLYIGVSSELLQPPVNAMRLTLHPFGLAPRIVNLAEWRHHAVMVLRQQVEARADSAVQAARVGVTGVCALPFSGRTLSIESRPSGAGAWCKKNNRRPGGRWRRGRPAMGSRRLERARERARRGHRRVRASIFAPDFIH